MVEFVHHKIKVAEGFLSKLIKVQSLFIERSFRFETEFNDLLTDLQTYFKSIKDGSKESDVLRLQGLLQVVKKGFDPIKLERLPVSRREFYWGIAFHVVEEVKKMIEDILTKERQKLDEAEDLLSNTFLSLIQNGILNNQELKKLDSVAKIELLWTEIVKQNASIALLDKKMKLQVTREDMYLLIEKIIGNMS
ncbi:hypothetical protein [Amniculibacterium aquaticum]|uniref:hypothetical protein n=1 Tax=Amniculibacterium aquaticum TaxID=2479858 RepID=UPI000F59A350|nr:hypothetical protein [Amniculibacterium aquaticum]